MIITLKRMKKLIFILALLVITIGAILCMTDRDGEEAPPKSGRLLRNKYEMVSYLNLLGWDVSDDFTEESVIIPVKFNNVYKRYNDIQLEQGFDLQDYKGKAVKSCTFSVKNYGKDEMYAVLLLDEERLIGGDIRGLRDGFIGTLN